MAGGSGFDRQAPEPGEIFLDHIGWYIADMDACCAVFERLGFVLTPYTEHSHADAAGNRKLSGTANRCAMTERGYLEFLTAVPDMESVLTRQLADGLDRYPGLHLIAFTCADAAAEYDRLEMEGFALQPLVRLRRPTTLDDGSEAMCAFSVIRTEPDAMEEGRIQTITQETPEAVWQPSLIARANAVDALTGVVVCVDHPAESAARFSRFTQKSPVLEEGRIDLVLDRGVVSFVTPEELSALVPGITAPATPFIAAVALRSRDLDATRQYFDGAGVAFDDAAPGRLIVSRDMAMGAAMVFHAPGAWPGNG